MMKQILFNLKLSLVFCCLAGMAQSTFAQDALKLRAKAFAYKVKRDNDEWTKWSDWESVNILVVIKDERITIYSKETQVYDVISVKDQYVDPDGDKVLPISAVDQDGDRCNIRLIFLTNEDRSQLYVDFNNIRWVYNVYSI